METQKNLLKDLKVQTENINLDEYLEFYKYVRDNMEHPEWLGTFTKDEIIEILKGEGKIFIYTNDTDIVCSMFYMPTSNKSLNKHNVYYDEKDTGALGPIMVSPKYIGHGLQTQMLIEFDKYCQSLGKKYIYTKVHSDNIYCLKNIYKSNYKLVDEYESERGMNSAFIKEI